MTESSGKVARAFGKGKKLPIVAAVVALIMISASVVVSSTGLSSWLYGSEMESVNTGLVITNLTHDPEEAYVDQNVQWVVVVDLQDSGQKGKGLLFTWDWDDGTYTVRELKSVNNSDTVTDAQVHSWGQPGVYEVKVSVWDGFGNENNKLHNVSETAYFVVMEEAVDRSIEYRWYDMFSHPFGPWYEHRELNYGNEYVVRDSYPYLYVRENMPPGNVQVHTFMQLDVDAANLTEVNMNENPEFLPLLGSDRGGNAVIDWHMDYLTWDEALPKLGDLIYWYDGWFVGLNGTVGLDRDAAKSVLGLSDAEFDNFDTWWAVNNQSVIQMWKEWLDYEASNDRLAIYNMYEYDLTIVYFWMDAFKVSDQVMIAMDSVSWGMEALMTRWLHEAFMPTEWYMEDMNFNAAIGPHHSELTLEAAVGYALTASEAIDDGAPCWTWQAMLQDYVKSSQEWPISEFDPYADLEYYNRYPGSDWHHEMTPYDYTPGSWNLSDGETLSFEWPSEEVLFLVDDPTNVGGGTVVGTLDLWSPMTVAYSEPMPPDAPGKVVIDNQTRKVTFTGPFDMWSWSSEQTAHSYLAAEWDRLGILPYGVPYIEFRATDEFNSPPTAAFTVSPSAGTVGTLFEFDASSSWDYEDPTEALEVRWDWQNDGAWDTSWTTVKLAAHIYAIPGTFEVALEVRDSGGLSGFAYESVFVNESSGLIPHDPILILNDDAFTAENGVVGGSGIPSDPYIIEGWDISAPSTPGILVEDVSSSFVIRDIHVHSDSGENEGILLLACSGSVVVENGLFEGFRSGIVAGYCFDLLIRDNICAQNSRYGIYLELCIGQVEIVDNVLCANGECGVYNNDSMDAFIFQNEILNNTYGVTITFLSENVSVIENEILGNQVGIRILQVDGMEDIWVVSNNLDNGVQVTTNTPAGVVSWDDGYAIGGNFWSDYSGADLYSGPGQDEPGSDGIGDTPYVIDGANQDGYPLMEPFGSVHENQPPVAAFIVTPQTGSVDTVFAFNASSSTDLEDSLSELEFRWDWQNDGVWDTIWTGSCDASHQFSAAGTYMVVLQVRDTGGLTDETYAFVAVIEVSEIGWGVPALVESDDTGSAFSPEVAMDSDGNAIAVWEQFDGAFNSVMASWYSPESGWSAAELIEANDMNAAFPQVCLYFDGSAVVVWSQYGDYVSSVWAVLYDPDTGWGTPELLREAPSPLECIPVCSLAGDRANGGAIAVWNQEDGSYSSIWACRLDYSGTWAEPELLETSNYDNAWSPQIATDQFNWTVVWLQYGYGWQSIWSARYNWDGWTEPEAIDGIHTSSVLNPAVAADAYGRAICVWQQYEDSWSSIFANRYVPGVGWGTPELIEHNNSGDALDPQIAMDPLGAAVVVWRQIVGHEIDGGPGDIHCCRYEIGTGWGPTQGIDPDPASDAWGPRIAMAYKAGPVVIWMRDDGLRHTIWASVYESGSWCSPELIGVESSYYAYPWDVAMNHNGMAIAMWHQYGNGVWNIWSNVYGFEPQPPPLPDSTLTYTVYDLFEEPWGPWWNYRVGSATWDTERLLTSDDGGVTYLWSEAHNPDGIDDQGLIYAPYRWNIEGLSVPHMDIHSPVFMPVLGSGPVPDAESSIGIYSQYVYPGSGSWWEDYWMATWSGEPDWVGDNFADGTDGYFLGTVYTVNMNREAAEEWLGMPVGEAPATWWAANGDYYETEWQNWIVYQGREVFDIFNGYDWPYYDLGTFMSLSGDSDQVTLEIAHLSWGWEALLTRWLAYTQLSINQPYFEDISIQVDYRDSDCDFMMDAVCQWSLHCVKANDSAPGDSAPCAWVWEPIALDYLHSSTSHPDSDYDPYYATTYQSWNCGDPLYGTEVAYEVAPAAMSLPSYAKLIIQLPMGDSVMGYYGENVPNDAIKSVWSGDCSDYDAIRYFGEMDLGYAMLGGCTDWTYDPVNKVMTINGPWNFTNQRSDGYLYHGAPWIEFNIVGPQISGNLDTEGESATPGTLTSVASISAELASMAGTICAVLLAVVALACSPNRRREY